MSATSIEQPLTKKTRPRARSILRMAAIFIGASVVALLLGFGSFVSTVKAYRVPDVSSRADGIVVLTGGYARLDPAVGLLRNKRGRELLITGVNENTSAETIRNVLSVDLATFNCCVTLDRLALDTVGNAEMAARWARQKGFESVLWVTNDYHMQRSLLEVTRVDPSLTVIPFPVSNVSEAPEDASSTVDRYRVLIGEYAKYLIALFRLPH